MKQLLRTLLIACTLSTPALAEDYFNVYSGAWDVFKDSEDGMHNNMAGVLGAEYRGEYLWRQLRPNLGALVTSEGAQYYYGGFGYDAFLADQIVLTPNVAVGYYRHGDGKNLGSDLEFKSGVELAYQWQDTRRLGIAIHHISNASIGNENPGTEIISLQYAYPLR